MLEGLTTKEQIVVTIFLVIATAIVIVLIVGVIGDRRKPDTYDTSNSSNESSESDQLTELHSEWLMGAITDKEYWRAVDAIKGK